MPSLRTRRIPRALSAFLALSALLAGAAPARATYTTSQAADLVLGQADFTSTQGNASASAGSLNNPQSIFLVPNSGSGPYTFVADTVNNRVLIYKTTAPVTGQLADYVLGQQDMFHSNSNFAGSPTAYTLSGPTCVYSDGIKLFVCDTNNNRVLIWNSIPSTNTVSADVVIGQIDKVSNSAGATGATLSVPHGITMDSSGVLYIADRNNNRVLVYDTVPTVDGASADTMLGQTILSGCVGQGQHSNCSSYGNNLHNAATATSLYNPTDVFIDTVNNRTYVADMNNNRVLVYLSSAPYLRQSADFVLGQPDFTTNECNYLGSPTAQTLCAPMGVWADGQHLVVADMFNNRTLVYNLPITTNQQAANVVIGQANMTSNGASNGPTGQYWPYGVYYDANVNQLFISQWQGNRVTVFNGIPASNNATISYVLGQTSTNGAASCNQGASAGATTLCHPTRMKGDTLGNLYLGDMYNYRALVYSLPITGNAQAATFVIGQPDFVTANQNNGGGVTAYNLGTVSGVGASTSTLVLADPYDHRITGYQLPITANQPQASFVLGQATFTTSGCNVGGVTQGVCGWWDWPGLGVWMSSGSVAVADVQNNRILYYLPPYTVGQLASNALGQPGLNYNDADERGVTSGSLWRPSQVSWSNNELYVADNLNARILVYDTPVPTLTAIAAARHPAAAHYVLGQSSFTYPIGQLSPGARAFDWNGTGADTLADPNGVFATQSPAPFHLYVEDGRNSRVLVWNSPITQNAQPADLVIGQASMNGTACNSGGIGPTTMCWGHGQPWADENSAFIVDAGRPRGNSTNHRILVFQPPPTSNQPAASVVLGQTSFITNAPGGASPFGLSSSGRAGGGIVSDGNHLAVVDALNNRVMIWNAIPTANDQGADIVLGQTTMSGSFSGTGASRFNRPMDVAWDGSQFFVVDKFNQRVLVWNGWPTTTDQPADYVIGQNNFSGTSCFAPGVSNGLCYPTSVYSDGKTIFVLQGRSWCRATAFAAPVTSNAPPALFAIGQPDRAGTACNFNGITGASLFRPHGIYGDGERLFIGDRRNYRFLEYTPIPSTSGVTATYVAGQPDFVTATPNNASAAVQTYGPMKAFSDGRRLFVPDWWNSTMHFWNSGLTSNQEARDGFLGGGSDASRLAQPTGAIEVGNHLWVYDGGDNRVLRYTSSQNTLFQVVITSALLPSTFMQGVPTPAMKLVVNAPDAGFPATWTSLKVYNNGALPDSSLQVRLYKDSNADGVLETGSDTAIGSFVTFSNGKATMNFAQSLDTTFATYFVAVQVDPTNLPFGPGGFPQASIRIFHNFNSFGFSNTAVEMGGNVPVGIAYNSGFSTPQDDPDYVAVAATSTLTSGADIVNTSTAIVMAQLQMATTNDWAFMNTLVVNRLGSGSDSDVAGLSLWLDANNDKVLEPGIDVNLMASSITFGGGQAFLSPIVPLAITTTGQSLLVVADFAGTAQNTTFGIDIDTSDLQLAGVDAVSSASTMPFASPLVTLRPAIGYATAAVATSAWWNGPLTFALTTGKGGVSFFRAAVDQSPTHAWTNTEDKWTGIVSTYTPGAAGAWYAHFRPYDSTNHGGNTIDLGPFLFDPTPPSGLGFQHYSSTGGWIGETQWDSLSSGATAELTIQDAGSGLTSTATVMPANVAGFWNFDLAPGTTVYDISGSTNELGFAGGASLGAGYRGSGLQLGGANYAATSGAPVNMPLGNSPRSCAAWVYPTSFANSSNRFLGYGANSLNQGFFCGLTGTAEAPAGRPLMGFSGNSAEGNLVLPLNQWSHVAATYDGAWVRFYVNGVLESSSTLPSGTPGTVPGPSLAVGWDSLNAGYEFTGRLDEVGIWSRALTDAEVSALGRSPQISVEYSTTAGATWNLYTSTDFSPVDPYLVFSSTWGGNQVESLSLRDMMLRASTTTLTCSGADPCVGATDQVRFTVVDRAGNVKTYGPFAMLVDTLVGGALPTLVSPPNSGYTGKAKPTFSWQRPDPTTYPGLSSYYLEVSSMSNFSIDTIWMSTPVFSGALGGGYISTTTLASGTTYYWRVRVLSFGGVFGPWSAVSTFQTDFAPPTPSNYVSLSSTGGAVAEFQFNDKESAVTAQLSVQDPLTGVNLDEPPDAATLLFYQFEENTGRKTSDSTGYGYPAYLTGGASWTQGLFGRGIALDGVSGYVAVDTSAASSLNNYSGALTVQLWVEPAGDISSDTTFLHKGNGTFAWILAYRSGQLVFGAQNGAALSCGVNAVCAPAAIVGGQWSLLTGTYDGVTLSLYVNGTLLGQTTYTGGYGINTDPLIIGSYQGSSQFFDGALDDVRLFSYVRSPAQVLADDSGGSPPVALYSNDAGFTWQVSGATYAVTAGAPFVSYTGATGSQGKQTYQLENIDLVQSTSTLTGAGATNQVRFLMTDVAGNQMLAGPYGVLFDSASLTAVSTPTVPGNGVYVNVSRPSFYWKTANLASIVQYQLQVSNDPNFGSTVISITTPAVFGLPIATYTATVGLAEGTTFYWRTQARTNLNRNGPWSETFSFVTDYTAPSTSTFVSINAEGQALSEGQADDLALGVTAQIDVQDLVSGMASIAPPAQPQPGTGVLGLWHFDEGAGTSAQDVAGGNTGTLGCQGASCALPAWLGSPWVGALAFSGSQGVTAANTNFDFPSNSTFTVEAWVRPSGTGVGTVAAVGSGQGGNGTNWAFEIGSGLSLFNNYYSGFSSPAGLIAPGVWQHVAMVARGPMISFYVDGVLVSSGTSDRAVGNAGPVTSPFSIGTAVRPSGVWDTGFNGAIDEVRVLSTGLTASQVQQDYAAQAPRFLGEYTTDAGSSWTTTASTYAIGALPFVALTGGAGSTAPQTLSVGDLDLVQSTNTAVCAGASPCGATNQVRFTIDDVAGNTKLAGPFSIIVDTTAGVAISTPVYPAGGVFVTTAQPTFLWNAPSTTTLAGLTVFGLEASRSASFSPLDVNITTANTGGTAIAYVSTYTLVEGATYYWRVRALDQLGTWSPYSAVETFVVDASSPANGAYDSLNSSNQPVPEDLANDMTAGATVELVVQDSNSGLSLGSYSVMYSTTAGQFWVDVSSFGPALTGTGETDVLSAAQFGNRMYFGTSPNGKIYSSVDGLGWSLMTSFPSDVSVQDLAVFNGKLYAATGAGKIYATLNGTIWTQVFASTVPLHALTAFAGKLYAATSGGTHQAFIYATSDGSTWNQAVNFPGAPDGQIESMAVYQGRLLASVYSGSYIYGSYDGEHWSLLATGVAGANGLAQMVPFNGYLYGKSGNDNSVWRTSDGANWTKVLASAGAGGGPARSLAVFNGKLYLGLPPNGAVLTSQDGVMWSQVAALTGETKVDVFLPFLGSLYAGADTDADIYQLVNVPAALTGSDGTTSAQTLSGVVSLTQSTNTIQCSGRSPCGATDQVLFTAVDRAGNSRTAGPFAVIVDTVAAKATPIAGVPAGYGAASLRPEVGWGLPTSVDPRAVMSYEFDLADSTDFVNGLMGSSVTANQYGSFIFNLTDGATYYWRVRSFSVAGASSAFSATQYLVVDTDTPKGSSFVTYDSFGNSVSEGVQLNLDSGVTAQLTVQDGSSGIDADGPAPLRLSTSTVLLWRFDEGSGGIAKDAGFNALDGIWLGSPAWISGRHGKAVRMDGSGGTYSYLNDAPALDPAKVTVEAWVRTSAAGWLVSKGDGAGHAYGLKVEADGSASAYFGTTQVNCPAAAALVDDGRWHMLAGSWDGATGRVYVDGAACASAAVAAAASAQALRVGQRGDGAGPYLLGAIDDLRVSAEARTAAQIASDYSAGGPFTVFVTTTAGASWQSVTNSAPGSGPYIVFSGAQYDEKAQSLQVRGLSLAASTNGVTCGGVSPCGATNQVRFIYADRAGNVESAGPYAVLVDTAMAQPAAISPPDGVFVSSANPMFSWSEGVAVARHEVQVSTDGFVTLNASSVTPWVALTSPWALSSGTTYYWRVRGVDDLGLTSPFSTINKFTIDLVGPSGSSFATVTSTGGLAGEAQFNDLQSNVTAQLTVQDLVSGLPAAAYGLSPDAGTVGLWHLDEGAGTVAGDSSGRGNSGSIGGFAGWVQGRIGQAVAFGGSQSIDVPYASSLNTPTAMTIEAWINTAQTNAGSDGQAVVTRWSGSSGFQLMTSRTGVGAGGAVSFYPGVGAAWLDGSRGIADGRWHHVAATYDGATARLYVDGTLDAFGALTNGLADVSTDLMIGAAPNDLQAVGFHGVIDEVRLSNAARTPAQIYSDYVSGAPYFVQVSTNGGASFQLITATYPAAGAPYVSVTGSAGSTAPQLLRVSGLSLAQSASPATCGGVGPCSATNQLEWTFSDRAGNVQQLGPYAMLVDTQLSQPLAGSPSFGAFLSTDTPVLTWSEKASMPTHVVQLSTDPVFGTLTWSTTTAGRYAAPPQLSQATTYYWRVKAQSAAGLSTSFSPANEFYIDSFAPGFSTVSVLNSTGGVIGETQYTTLPSGVTAYIAVLDAPAGLGASGLAVSNSTLPFAGDGHDDPGATSGFGVMYSTTGGQVWIDYSSAAATLSATGETQISAFAAFNGRLYAATVGSGRVYSSADGMTWTLSLFGTGESAVESLAVFNGKLYAGTFPSAKVYVTADGSSWSQAYAAAGETDVRSLVVFDNKLYAGTAPSGLVLASSDGSSWSTSLSGSGENAVASLAVFNGRLYAGTEPNAKIYSTPDGFNWTPMYSAIGESSVKALAVYNGRLYAGTNDGVNGRVYASADGSTWAQVFAAAGQPVVWSLASYGGKLYAGTGSSVNMAKLFVSPDGAHWLESSAKVSGETDFYSLAPFNGALYAGTAQHGDVVRLAPLQASLTGADGTGRSETLAAAGLNFVQSQNTSTCGGAWGCSATDELIFSASDRAGNAAEYGPYAVLVDSSVPQPQFVDMLALSTDSIRVDLAPVVDGLSGTKDYQFYISSSSNFAFPVSTTSFVATSSYVFTGLQQVTTYYVRAVARDNMNNISPYSIAEGTATTGVMFFSTQDVAVANVLQGLESPMLRFTLSIAPGPQAVFNAVNVTRVGGVDGDVSQVEVWSDANGDGVWQSTADVMLAAAPFSGGGALISLGANFQNIGTTPQNFFIVYKLSPTGIIGDALSAQLGDYTAIGFGNSYRVPGAFPMTSGASTIQDGPNSVIVQPASEAPVFAAPGQADVAMLRLRMQTDVGTSKLASVVLNLTGTATSNEIAAVRVYRDANSNGSFDPGVDGLVTNGNDVFVGGVSTLTFTALSSSMTVSPTLTDYFVTFNLAASAASGDTFGVELATGTELALTGPDTAYLTVTPAASSLTQVVQPNTLTVSPFSLTPAAASQGQEYAVLKTTMTVDQAFASVGGLSVNRTGTSTDGDVSRVSVWLDGAPPAVGGYFNPGVDVLLGTGTFSGGKAQIGFTPRSLTAGTTYVLFVVYDINPFANPGDTIGGSLTNSAYVSVYSTATTTAGTFPFASATATINPTVNTLLIPTAQDVTTGGLLQGTTNSPLLRLDVRADQNAITWNTVSITKTGTAPDSDIDAVEVYEDVNGNFTLDVGTDTLVSSGSDKFVSGKADITFPSAQTVAVSSVTYFIAVSVDPLANPGDTFGLQIATTTAFTLNAPNVVSSQTAAFPLSAGPVPIQQYPNNITVSTATISPLQAAPGAADVGLLKLTANTDVSNARWTGLKVDRVGASDADFSAVKVYYDINQIGSWNASQPGQYLLISSTSSFGAQGTPGTVNVSFSTTAFLSRTPQTYFVVVDMSTSAVPGDVFSARILNNNYFTVNAPNAVLPTFAQSNNTSVSTPPSLMVVQAVSSAPATVLQSQTNAPILRLSAWMQQYSAQWVGMTVLEAGSALDGDVSRVKLYYDANGNGSLDTLLDTLIATGTFQAGQAALSFNRVETVTTSTRTYFLVYDIAATATPNATVGASLNGPGSLNILAPNGAANTGFPMASSLATISPTVSGVYASAQDKAPAALMQGATAQLMATLTLNTTQYSVLWNTLSVTRTGTGSDGDISAVHVYKDANGNGVIDASDPEITSGNDRFTGGVANIVLGTPQQIDVTPQTYLLAVDAYMFSSTTGTIGLEISSAAAIGVPSPNYVVNSGFPIQTSNSPLVKRPDGLQLTWTSLVPNGINQGTEVAMARVTAQAQRDRVTWTGVRLLKQGSLPDGFVNQARLYLDADNNGLLDAADVLVGTGTMASGAAGITMSSVQDITTSSKTYIVSFVFDVNSTVGDTIGFSFPDATYGTVQSPDFVAAASSFTSATAPILDARTPTQPVVTLDGPFWKSFEEMHFLWSSTVALGSITQVWYAIGTAPGAQDALGWTALTPIVNDVTSTGLALQSGTTYYVSVRAMSSFGFMSPTGVSQPILVDLTVPAVPAVSATVGNVSVLLDWGKVASGPSGLMGYLVEYRTGDTPVWFNAKTGQKTTDTTTPASLLDVRTAGSGTTVTAADVVNSLSYSLKPNSSTLFVRVSGVSGAGVVGDSSTPMRLLFGSLPPGGIADVSSYPNPFDSRKEQATINYTLSADSDVSIKIYSIYGSLIKEMHYTAGGQGGIAGANDVTWDGTDNGGSKTSKGVYIAVLQAGGAKVTYKIAVIH